MYRLQKFCAEWFTISRRSMPKPYLNIRFFMVPLQINSWGKKMTFLGMGNRHLHTNMSNY